MQSTNQNNPTGPSHQPATRTNTQAVQAWATALDFAAILLEAQGNGGPAETARATALLLHLIAMLDRPNDQR